MIAAVSFEEDDEVVFEVWKIFLRKITSAVDRKERRS